MCRTPAGKNRRLIHVARRVDAEHRLRTWTFRVRVKADDSRLGLSADEVYMAQRYRLDPGSKVSLLSRESDGWDPECNQYHHEVEFLGWLAPVLPEGSQG